MERLRYAHTWKSAIENITKLPFEASLKQMVRLDSISVGKSITDPS